MTKDEYEARHKASYRVEGFGIDGMTVHLPCPFCAAPNFIAYKLLDLYRVLGTGATCGDCGRSARAAIAASASSTQFELVQTGGSDPPDFIPIRRETKG